MVTQFTPNLTRAPAISIIITLTLTRNQTTTMTPVLVLAQQYVEARVQLVGSGHMH